MSGPSRPRGIAELRARRAQVDEPGPVLEAAARFLEVRPRSLVETRRRLRWLGYREALIEEVLERLVELGYLDDEAFGRAWLESRDRARPRGETALRRELALKGLERGLIESLLAERSARSAGGDEGGGHVAVAAAASGSSGADLGAAARLLERRRSTLLREADLRRRTARAYALLARSGFDPDTIRGALASADLFAPGGEAGATDD